MSDKTAISPMAPMWLKLILFPAMIPVWIAWWLLLAALLVPVGLLILFVVTVPLSRWWTRTTIRHALRGWMSPGAAGWGVMAGIGVSLATIAYGYLGGKPRKKSQGDIDVQEGWLEENSPSPWTSDGDSQLPLSQPIHFKPGEDRSKP